VGEGRMLPRAQTSRVPWLGRFVPGRSGGGCGELSPPRGGLEACTMGCSFGDCLAHALMGVLSRAGRGVFLNWVAAGLSGPPCPRFMPSRLLGGIARSRVPPLPRELDSRALFRSDMWRRGGTGVRRAGGPQPGMAPDVAAYPNRLCIVESPFRRREAPVAGVYRTKAGWIGHAHLQYEKRRTVKGFVGSPGPPAFRRGYRFRGVGALCCVMFAGVGTPGKKCSP